MLQRLISIAPMMDCTDKHFRYFLRLISPNSLLYTEMVTTQAILHGDKEYLLGFNAAEHPLALQLGGSDPKQLQECALIGEQYGYKEINLNVGCPSARVKSGQFGACLMLQPHLVAEAVFAMRSQVKIPITVKCRIGVDNQDSYEKLQDFIQIISEAGCEIFIIHARKAWLNGLSPKENREIPPLRYDVVRNLKIDFPKLTIIINGGIKTIEDIAVHLQQVDGVMIGREAYSNPYFLAEIENQFFGNNTLLTRQQVLEKFVPYIETELIKKIKVSNIVRHILGLFHGQIGARKWRRYLSENIYRQDSGVEVIKNSLEWL